MMTTPLYELRCYQLNPKDMVTATKLVTEKHEVRTKHSKLFGFWTSSVGGGGKEFIHLWEYENMSHRRDVYSALNKDPEWISKLLMPILPCIQSWNVTLLTRSPGFNLNLTFEDDPSAVYVLDKAEVKSYDKLPKLKVNQDGTEILVGRFCEVFGASKTEYRLWRYTDIEEAAEAVWQRKDESFDGITRLLEPAEFSPLL